MGSFQDILDFLQFESEIPENTTKTDNKASNPVQYAATEPHRAHITFVHTAGGGLKPIVKRKRKRTSFTTEQVQILEDIFFKRPYVTREERQVLTEKLQVSDKTVKVWFQNRRLRVKREKEETEQAYTDDPIYYLSPTASPLAYVESQLHRADPFGYVTLDDRAVTELVNVIDHFLPYDTDLTFGTSDSESGTSVSEPECSVIYEPISPADFTENTNDFSQNTNAFEAIDSEQSLQHLLDMHYSSYS